MESLDTIEDVLVLHLGMFWDGFQKNRNSKTGSASFLMATLLELSSTLRWRSEFDAQAPFFVVEALPGVADKVNQSLLPVVTAQLKHLS